MAVNVEICAWSDLTVAYCTGRADRSEDMAPIARIIDHYSGWCETLALDLSTMNIGDPSLVFAVYPATARARTAGTRILMRLNSIRRPLSIRPVDDPESVHRVVLTR